MELVYGHRGRSSREKRRKPIRRIEIGQALLMGRRLSGQAGRAIVREDRDCLDHLAVNLRNGDWGVGALVVDAPSDEILHGGSGAAIGNVCDVYIEGRIQQRASEVASGPRSARAVLNRCLVWIPVGDELV